MKTLCGMSTDELASSHLKEERKRIRDESYAGHMRPEEEGNEIVYKDGALQKIDKVKSDAKKQGLATAPASLAAAGGATGAGGKTSGKASKKARKGSGGGGMGSSADGGDGGEEGRKTGGGAVGSRVKIELRGSGRNGGDDYDEDEEEGEAGGGHGVRGRRGSGAGPVELKRRLSSSSDVGKDGGGEGGETSLTKRIKKLSAGSPMIDDVPK